MIYNDKKLWKEAIPLVIKKKSYLDIEQRYVIFTNQIYR